MIPWLEDKTPFPPLNTALTEEDGAAGLLAAGADLSPERLLDAYRKGIFPWFSDGQPVLWWSTDPRMVLKIDDFKISKSLEKTIRKLQKDSRVAIKFDSAFELVMQYCAAPRTDHEGNESGTWITAPIIDAYTELHRRGYAHSAEMWIDDELVGGAYGVCIGRMFYGESMFARVTDASKVVLTYLVNFLKSHQVPMIDCQQQTSHLASLGAKPILRGAFVKQIGELVDQPPIMEWNPIGPGV